MIIKLIVWLCILAWFHSLQETQIEGKNGWARHLPTFRVDTFITKLLIGKELSGYHIYMLIMWIIMFHGAFIFIEWSLNKELLVWGYFLLYFVLEDFLFFIVNPHYRIQNFKKGNIPWHTRWAFCLPVSYWIAIIAGIIFLHLGLK